MDRARYATGEEEDGFPFGSDKPLGNTYEETAQPQAAGPDSPVWDNDYGNPHQYDSLDEEVEADKPL